MLNVKMPNGDVVSAPVEAWVATILSILPPLQLAMVCEKLSRVTQQKQLIVPAQSAEIEASRHHVMHAEPIRLGLKM